MSEVNFDLRSYDNGGTMTVNGLSCVLNLPTAKEARYDATGKEISQGLPEYSRRAAFVADEYPTAPEAWMRGSATSSSYFVPVRAGRGLWLDLNGCRNHTHHVAAVISVQGVNAITGQPTDVQRLEQYRENCPVHDVPFGHDRFCEKCGYKWDAQNYLATTGTPSGYFWLDGFRAQDGETRQFVFTEEEARGVAAQIIGANRVFAIGIQFFLSKEPKPVPAPTYRSRGSFGGNELYAMGGMKGGGTLRSMSFRSRGAPELEVTYGARISQRIYADPNSLDYWEEKPAGTIFINYVDEDTCRAILADGRRDMTQQGDGFLAPLHGNEGPISTN